LDGDFGTERLVAGSPVYIHGSTDMKKKPPSDSIHGAFASNAVELSTTQGLQALKQQNVYFHSRLG
jgi:hypothetical protein